MSYRLKADEPVAEGLSRIIRREVEKAGECLRGTRGVDDERIHDSRKAMKRARSALRLVRKALSKPVFGGINGRLRDIARPLSRVRDADVMLDTLTSLRKRYGDATRPQAIRQLAKELQSERRNAWSKCCKPRSLAKLRSALQRVADDSEDLKFHAQDWNAVGKSIRRIYRDGSHAYDAACIDRTDERLHEWRKQVKHLWYGLKILEPMRPGRIGELADQAHRLADYLGDDHDLAILRQRMLVSIDDDPGATQVSIALVDTRRGELQHRAIMLGERLFNGNAKTFERKLAKCWRQWREAG